jgi:hypothetical protein
MREDLKDILLVFTATAVVVLANYYFVNYRSTKQLSSPIQQKEQQTLPNSALTP